MVETDAYFEAFRHNLSALQEIKSDEFPLSKYIVGIQNEVRNPAYLNQYTTYDMGPLFHSLNYFKEKSLADVRCPQRLISVLSEEKWPTEKELSLDKSQYEALKAATTKEFAVIQGPPGTGKTYIGLRIVQLLLHNISCWKATDRPCPILIVCYTNHALDQFLEGVLLFTEDIVRVGGRSLSEKMSSYQLSNLRKTLQDKREVPRHIFSNLRHKNWMLSTLGGELNKLQKEIEKSVLKVLSEGDMLHCINSKHYDSLKSFTLHTGSPDDGYIMHDWLDIRYRETFSEENPFHSQYTNPEFIQTPQNVQYEGQVVMMNDTLHAVARNNMANYQTNFISTTGSRDQQTAPAMYVNNAISMANNGTNELNDEEDQEEEGDIQYIEDMRVIDDDEFAGIDVFQDQEEVVEDEPEQFGFHGEGGWKTQGGAKKKTKYITKKLKESSSMNEEEANKVTDVWKLGMDDRWRLYKYWLNLFNAEKQKELTELQGKIRTEYAEISEMKIAEDLHVLRDAKVVGMTTTGAAKYRNIVQQLNPRIVIVEEAAEILESHIVTSLAADTQHLILIGDHQQLRPSPNVYELAVRFNLNVSLFERMINNGMDFKQLIIQHRMRPCISALLVPHIYKDLKDHDSVCAYESIKGVCKNMYFVNHSFTEGQEFDSKSRVNKHEASFIVALCRYLILQGYTSSEITVLTTYSGQFFVIRNLMKSSLLKGVRVTVVDNFQGEENEIILISFVRSNEEGNIGFLKIPNRVCVALSRAKKGLFAIGNFTLLAEKSELWKNIVASLSKQGAIGPTFPLVCQNHPDTVTVVSTETDFNKVPEGGCTRLCEYRLTCGHTCPRMCHAYDSLHENVQCTKPCGKIICNNNHQCPKSCYKKCGPCKIPVPKLIPRCKHEVHVPCNEPAETFSCSKLVEKSLACGHKRKMRCGENNVIDTCIQLVDVKLDCGHFMKIECCEIVNKSKFLHRCSAKCESELLCGHICSGTCGKCHQGRLHQTCKQPCKRILVCGHECGSSCAKSCPPCKKKCENRCNHSQCPSKCGFPCTSCKEPCLWQCKHYKCDKACGELCDRGPCDFPCTEKLKCRHDCIGLCGEPCPNVCRICNPDIKDIFFGAEDEDDARFIQLEDCNHVFEVEGLTHWMQMAKSKDGEIQMKTCPKCKTVIRKNLRFGNIIKTCLADVEKVKSIIFGQVDANKRKVSLLVKRISKLKTNSKASLLGGLEQVLNKNTRIGSPEIIRSENIIALMEEYLKIDYYNSFHVSSLLSKVVFQCTFSDFIMETRRLIEQFIRDEYLTASDQQLDEISWEIQRLKLAHKFLKFFSVSQRDLTKEANYLCTKINENLCKCGPFRVPEEDSFNKSFNELQIMQGTAVISVSESEKRSILKAMNLSQGHWFMCPNGHVYCITECGGAMQESKCNECGARIGGTNHTLRSDNRLATDMDGSVVSAWPQANDLRNYQF